MQRENFPPHTHGDEFKETPGNPLGEGEKSLWKKITRYDNRSFLHQGRSLTAALSKREDHTTPDTSKI